MKTQISSPKLAALAVVPLLGCLLLSWIGANRPEKLIVGAWRVQSTAGTIEFNVDGTFIETDQMSTVPAETYNPSDTSAISTFIPAELYVFRRWGRYTFLNRSHLQFDVLGEQENGKQTVREDPPKQSRRSQDPPKWMPNVEVKFEGDQVRVISFPKDVWKRIE